MEQLDLAAILDTYDEERGFPPFHPAMMVALLLYAYTQEVFSSRKIAKAALEKEAADQAKAEKKDDDEEPPEPPKVDPKAQRNFTDPESRIMPTKNGFEQCFNAQAAVDAEAQVIVPEDQSLYRHGPPEARHQGRNPCQERQGRKPDRKDAGAAEARWLAKSLPAAETSGRTRFRPDQAGDGLPSIPAAGACQGHGRMVDGLHGPQPPETGEGHGMSLGDIVKMLQ